MWVAGSRWCRIFQSAVVTFWGDPMRAMTFYISVLGAQKCDSLQIFFKKCFVSSICLPTIFCGLFVHRNPSIQSDFGWGKRFFAIFLPMDGALPIIRLLRWVAESKEELGRLLLRYSEYESGPGNYPNQQHEVREVDENPRNYFTRRSYDLLVFVPSFRAKHAQALGW